MLTLLGLAAGSARAAEGPDVVVLKDGRRVQGTIIREDENAVFLRVENGEERGIARLRIDKIIKGAGGAGVQAAEKAPVGPAPGPAAQQPVPEPKLNEPNNDLQAETNAIYQQLVDLGHSRKDKRKAAMDRAKELGFRALPILLAIFHPKQRTTPELRIGALRALVELAPLDQMGAETLGYVAMKDPDAEVRREACHAIKAMKETRSMNYLLIFSVSEDKRLQYQAAKALREIDDERAFSTLAMQIPQPEVQNANPDARGTTREIELPVGPLSTKTTVFLPEGPVAGTMTNISSPMADALKIISGKDLGNFQGVWVNWVLEKIGATSQKDRDEAYKKRSIKDRTGSPAHAP
ncbi:MAG: HEAT repeat domain-containing protein [Planctomycetota bacterium]|nr:HEAT repeat domain-containing protein [Planctomycetota bacterium]